MIFEMSCKKLNPDIDRSITLEKYTEIWLQTIAPDKLEKSTLVREKQDIKRFKPYLGSYKLVDLRPEHFRSLYTKLRKQKNKATGKPLSEATVEGVHSCLCGILSDAMEGGYLDHNPAWRTYKYAGQKKEKKIADDETVKKLIQALETVSILYEIYFKLIIATGMRRGECCALKWEDINYAERSIHVCRNAIKTTGDEIIVKAPKTKAGNRYVYFSGEMESLLREYEAFCAAETERYDRREQTKDDYVFRRKGMKLPMTPSTFTWRFKKILKANDLPTDLNVHSLRHTAASLFIASGTDVGTVAGLLGHSQPSTTLDTLLFEVPSDTEDETIWYDVYLRERPGRDADWTYSDALYHVIRSVDNYGDYRYSFILCSERGEADYPQSTAAFTNIYTASASSGAITVKKTDAIGNPLAGAVFALENSRGDAVYTATSNSLGEAQFTNVGSGVYTLVEQAAPEGYVLSDQSYVLSVSGSDVTVGGIPYSPVTFVNRKAATLNREDHYTFLVGYPDGSFGPSRNMTRAEVTTMFARLLTEQIEPDKTYTNTFNDVPKSHWAANYIGYMQQFGIINGYNGSFRPNDPVTRAEFAAIASRFEKLTEGTKSFSDVPSTHWAAKYINFAATRGWVTGYPDGTFKPGNPITRAEVAAVTCRLLERTADQDYIRNHPHELRTFHDMTENHWAYWYAMEAANGHDYTKIAGGEQWSAIHP